MDGNPLIGQQVAFDTGSRISVRMTPVRAEGVARQYQEIRMDCEMQADQSSLDANGTLLYNFKDIKTYKITGLIADSGQASVYRAERSNKQYAIKLFSIYRFKIKSIQRAIQEAQLTLALRNEPNFPMAYYADRPRSLAGYLDGYDVQEENNAELLPKSAIEHWKQDEGAHGESKTGLKFHLAIVMEYIEGKPMSDFMQDKDSLNLADRVSILMQVMTALSVLHRFGIIHRDLKPANIMLKQVDMGASEKRIHAYIIDLGICKIIDRKILKKSPLADYSTCKNDIRVSNSVPNIVESAEEEQCLRTPTYFAPEQISDVPVGYYTDIFLVAMIAYAAFSYQKTIDDERGMMGFNFLISVEEEPIPALCEFSESFREHPKASAISKVLARAMAHHPANRYSSMYDFQYALQMAFLS